MYRSALLGFLLLTIAAIALAWSAGAETRIALVIGNSAYPSGPLSSPKDDAKVIEAKLKALGFRVTRKTDLGREQFFNAIRDFGDGLQQPSTVGLFYYSGHGMQVNNRNYMIPIDADIRSDFDVGRYAVPVEDVLVRMELGKSNPNIIILDACRNNPFEKRFKSSQDGLAQMDAPASTLIAFAAAPGRVTEAGLGGKLSPYTEALVAHIDQPYPNFVSMFQAVQNAVYERSERKQSPHLDLSPGLPDFSFTPVVAATPSPALPSVNTPANLLSSPANIENFIKNHRAATFLRITSLTAPSIIFAGSNITIKATYYVIPPSEDDLGLLDLPVTELWSYNTGIGERQTISKSIMVTSGERKAEITIPIPKNASSGGSIEFTINIQDGPSDTKDTRFTTLPPN